MVSHRTLTAGGESDPVIPPAQQRRALKVVNDVNRHVKVMRRFDGRINNLQLFSAITRACDGKEIAQSDRQWHDHPIVQLLLQRRDRYQELERDVRRYQDVINDFAPTGKTEQALKAAAVVAICKLEMQSHKELEAMELCLSQIRKELGLHLMNCQKFVTDLIKISQAERFLQYKTGGGDTDMTDDLLDAKLADAEG